MNSEPTETKLRRRRLRFCLRTMLVLILVAGVFLASWAISARRQRLAVDAIRAAGASVGYDVSDDLYATGPSAPAKKWVQDIGYALFGYDVFDLFGYDYFCRATSIVALEDCDADAVLSHCPELPHLRFLWLHFSDASDLGITHLRDHPSLEDLQLEGCKKITDHSIPMISRIRSLRSLNLCETRVTIASMPDLAGMNPLQYLDLRHTGLMLTDTYALQMALRETQVSP